MDIHQKVSIAIFGSLLLGTLAMYGTGGLSSSILSSNALKNGDNPCTGDFMRAYAKDYPGDSKKMTEIQGFITQNCLGDVVESKKSYCEARGKQLETYAGLVERYESCRDAVPQSTATTDVDE